VSFYTTQNGINVNTDCGVFGEDGERGATTFDFIMGQQTCRETIRGGNKSNYDKLIPS